MTRNFSALSWAATGAIFAIYYGAQILNLGNPSGLYYIAASPIVGAALYALRRRLDGGANRSEAAPGESESNEPDVNEIAATEPAAPDEAPALDPQAEIARRARRDKLIAAIVILLSAPLFSWINEAYVRTEAAWYALAVVNFLTYALSASLWCYFDSAQFGLTIHPGYRVLVFLFPAIGFPVYAFKTRGVKQGLALILAGALLMMLSLALTKSVLMLSERYFRAQR